MGFNLGLATNWFFILATFSLFSVTVSANHLAL